MKKIHFFPALLLLPAMASAQGEYTIKGKVGRHNAPVKVYLRYPKDGKLAIDSAQLTNGAFQFSGTTEAPVKATLVMNYGPDVPRAVAR